MKRRQTMKDTAQIHTTVTCDECGETISIDTVIFATKYRNPVTLCHACAQEKYTLCPVCCGNVYDADFDKKNKMCKMCMLYE